jgi:hypothetical protein
MNIKTDTVEYSLTTCHKNTASPSQIKEIFNSSKSSQSLSHQEYNDVMMKLNYVNQCTRVICGSLIIC